MMGVPQLLKPAGCCQPRIMMGSGVPCCRQLASGDILFPHITHLSPTLSLPVSPFFLSLVFSVLQVAAFVHRRWVWRMDVRLLRFQELYERPVPASRIRRRDRWTWQSFGFLRLFLARLYRPIQRYPMLLFSLCNWSRCIRGNSNPPLLLRTASQRQRTWRWVLSSESSYACWPT